MLAQAAAEGITVEAIVFVECFNRPAEAEAKWVLDMIASDEKARPIRLRPHMDLRLARPLKPGRVSAAAAGGSVVEDCGDDGADRAAERRRGGGRVPGQGTA